MGRTLLIGSCEPFSGKSAVVLGIARELIASHKKVRYGKPLATSLELDPETKALPSPLIDDDVSFIGETLGLGESQLIPSLHLLSPFTARKRLCEVEKESVSVAQLLHNQINNSFEGFTLLEGAGSLEEGLLYGLSLVQVSKELNAPVLLAHHWKDSRSVEPLLASNQLLGKNLLGVVLNAVNPDEIDQLKSDVVPSLERLGIKVFGVMPRSPLLRSVTVGELIRRLQANILCCHENSELLVETLSIGAMNVNSAMEFFRRRRNMAVVTGVGRTDIQLAALEASTQCLILTGAGHPLPQLINRAEELDVPVLKVEHDTLSTVEVIEQAFGHVRLHESVKATFAFRLVEEHCELDRIFKAIGW